MKGEGLLVNGASQGGRAWVKIGYTDNADPLPPLSLFRLLSTPVQNCPLQRWLCQLCVRVPTASPYRPLRFLTLPTKNRAGSVNTILSRLYPEEYGKNHYSTLFSGMAYLGTIGTFSFRRFPCYRRVSDVFSHSCSSFLFTGLSTHLCLPLFSRPPSFPPYLSLSPRSWDAHVRRFLLLSIFDLADARYQQLRLRR